MVSNKRAKPEGAATTHRSGVRRGIRLLAKTEVGVPRRWGESQGSQGRGARQGSVSAPGRTGAETETDLRRLVEMTCGPGSRPFGLLFNQPKTTPAGVVFACGRRLASVGGRHPAVRATSPENSQAARVSSSSQNSQSAEQRSTTSKSKPPVANRFSARSIAVSGFAEKAVSTFVFIMSTPYRLGVTDLGPGLS